MAHGFLEPDMKSAFFSVAERSRKLIIESSKR
jgi:hypothetical protein